MPTSKPCLVVLTAALLSCGGGQEQSTVTTPPPPPTPAPAPAPEVEPEPRECSTEREDALAYTTNVQGADKGPVLVKEWDGTPFLFYFNRNGLPESETAEAERVLEVVGRLSDHIEGQIGYSIMEVGGWMDEEIEFPFQTEDECDWREPGQIVAMVVPEADDGTFGNRPYCAIWAALGPLEFADGIVAHQTFHNFGFAHHPLEEHQPGLPQERGVPMSLRLSGHFLGPDDLGVTFQDVDALRCIFPQ